MARYLRVLTAAATLAAAAGAWAQQPDVVPSTAPTAEGEQSGSSGKKRGGKMSPEFENVRKALEALTPEQRKRFQENFLRWSDLPPERKTELRNRDEVRRRRMKEEIETTLKESGLALTEEQRDLFTKRYAQERRKIEEQVRREMVEKRKPLIRDLVERLKTEFAKPAAESGAAQAAEAPQVQP